MKKLPYLFLVFTLSITAFLYSCSGESGIYNKDAGPDEDTDITNCPEARICGAECCETDEECVNGRCLPVCEHERCLTECCAADEECVNGMQCLPICENTRCGENLTICCDAGEICLDGVDCAVECADNETLCGENLDTCCSSDEVCLNNQCVTPGDTCSDNFDCPDDTWYCEQTLGVCLPVPPGDVCEGQPTFNDIEPVLEWYWRGTSYGGKAYTDSMAAPMVGDVNGDGIPDIVVVLFYDNDYNTDSIIAVLNGAGDGAGGGQLLFTIPSANDPTAPKPFGGSSVALANFDSDPGLEIVYNVQGGGVRIEDNDGTGAVCDTALYPGCAGERYSGASYRHIHGGPSVADVDGDGMPDVILACHVLNGHNISDPALDFVNDPNCGRNTVVADLNQDGKPEVIDARHAITIDPAALGGTPLWTDDNGITSGFIAVGDIIPDIPGPEVVNVYGYFSLINGQDGSVLIGSGGSLADQLFRIPGEGNGGAPTIADFDGDGLPEISTAGKAEYVVYDPDCWDPPLRTGGQCASGRTDLILWSTSTQDLSSSMTGSSVFDFQGDGPAEVLYNDECFFHIYDGLTGNEVVNPVIPGSSGTLAEYPLVADVDGDGNAEMIVVSNKYAVAGLGCRTHWKDAGIDINMLCEITDCTAGSACTGGVGGTCDGDYQCDSSGTCQLPGGTVGVRVYGDAHDSWVRTRPIWNQFNYHVTNISYTNGIWNTPKHEQANWLSYNNYRQNVQGGALFPVPDFTVELTATTICPDEVRLVATVRNIGSAGAVPGVKVNFYRTDSGTPQLIGTKNTTSLILPGGWERISFVYTGVEVGVQMYFSASVNGSSDIEECNSDNNENTAGPEECLSIGK